jgi:hypothetical protein
MRRRAGLLLASIAIALHAFWPLIAQARPDTVALVPICTVGGETHYTEVPLGKTPAEEQSASHFEHCSLCSLGGERAVMASGTLAISPMQSPSCRPSRTAAWTFESKATPSARPRGPPGAS